MTSRVKQTLKQNVNRAVTSSIPALAATPAFIAMVQHVAALFPHRAEDESYSLPAFPDRVDAADPYFGLPVPPEVLRATYGDGPETYLRSGHEDIATLRELLVESGAPIEELGRIMDFGVAGGRLIRHLADLAAEQEIWGVDVWATAILWCQEHLAPPFNFVTTTVIPHLPFEDRSFGLVMAGSVWTHLDDLAEAWALELHRVLRPGGRLYFTINDRSAARIFEGGGDPEDRQRYIERVQRGEWDAWIARLHANQGYRDFLAGRAQMVAIGRSTHSQVLWDADYLIKRLGPGWRVCSITPAAYGHQTGVLLERK